MTLVDVFRASAVAHADRVALFVDDEEISYAELAAAASRVAEQLRLEHVDGHGLHGVWGAASAGAFQGILGTLMSGAGYVPLNPTFPVSRTVYMLEASGVSFLIVDHFGREKLEELLSESSRSLTLLLIDASVEEVTRWRDGHPEHRFLGPTDLPAPRPEDGVPSGSSKGGSPGARSDIAYVMFTSGSTGKPKGVMISHANILSYLEAMKELYDFTPDDRFSQMFDLTFDLSLFDMFVCWGAGAALYVVPQKNRMAPAGFIRRHELSVWFSVPAVAGFMNQLRMLKPDNFPSLRISAFCGEPLPASVTEKWQAAAPNSLVDNLYGPTELTVACTAYRWNSDSSPPHCENGVVPIGRPYSQLEIALVDAQLAEVTPGEAGELCVRGPQTSLGYWQNEKMTNQRFVAMPWMSGEDNRWYRTGDLVRTNENGDLIFVGRVDNQVKILGYRVELGEIEARLREHGRTDFAIAVPWPVKDGSASGVVACLAGSEVPDEDVLQACKRDLPDYMVPSRIYHFDRMPLNANGKIDRNQLRERVEEMSGAAT